MVRGVSSICAETRKMPSFSCRAVTEAHRRECVRAAYCARGDGVVERLAGGLGDPRREEGDILSSPVTHPCVSYPSDFHVRFVSDVKNVFPSQFDPRGFHDLSAPPLSVVTVVLARLLCALQVTPEN